MFKYTAIGVILLVANMLIPQQTAAADANTCPPLTTVTSLPMKGGPITEAHRILVNDPSCGGVLLAHVTSSKLMPDPRCPVYPGFAEGDLAVFLLMERLNVDFEQILPQEAWANFSSQGVYAYFDFVTHSDGRAYIQDRLSEILKEASEHAH